MSWSDYDLYDYGMPYNEGEVNWYPSASSPDSSDTNWWSKIGDFGSDFLKGLNGAGSSGWAGALGTLGSLGLTARDIYERTQSNQLAQDKARADMLTAEALNKKYGQDVLTDNIKNYGFLTSGASDQSTKARDNALLRQYIEQTQPYNQERELAILKQAGVDVGPLSQLRQQQQSGRNQYLSDLLGYEDTFNRYGTDLIGVRDRAENYRAGNMNPITRLPGDINADGVVDEKDTVWSSYNTLFGRDPEQGGLDYWVGQLNSNNLPEIDLHTAMLGGALGSDVQAALDRGYSVPQYTIDRSRGLV